VATYVTLDQVKARLRITTTADDVDLQALADQAEAHILDWCSKTPRSQAVVDSWTPTTVPLVVVAAILVQTAELDRFRGDDTDAPPRGKPDGEELGVKVRELLRAYHDVGIG
jgi:Phage gp6-like head-tail connector protein